MGNNYFGNGEQFAGISSDGSCSYFGNGVPYSYIIPAAAPPATAVPVIMHHRMQQGMS
jgi:hypothetical protein